MLPDVLMVAGVTFRLVAWDLIPGIMIIDFGVVVVVILGIKSMHFPVSLSNSLSSCFVCSEFFLSFSSSEVGFVHNNVSVIFLRGNEDPSPRPLKTKI